METDVVPSAQEDQKKELAGEIKLGEIVCHALRVAGHSNKVRLLNPIKHRERPGSVKSHNQGTALGKPLRILNI